jgi:hypothetical protein
MLVPIARTQPTKDATTATTAIQMGEMFLWTQRISATAGMTTKGPNPINEAKKWTPSLGDGPDGNGQ